ncbi:MAG: ATP-binding cassette domain-containing protein, partial [bacterium]|nr:ATP-binding cassette domain-containing protein [bacterium]
SVLDDDERAVVKGISLEVRRGEIVGMAGVEGNGQVEFVEALLGIRAPAGGQVLLEGSEINEWTVRQRREAGVGYIPEDRHRRGLLLPAPLWENAMCGHQSKEPYSRHGFWLTPKAARQRTRELIAAFDVRTPGPDVAAHALSGGNQQKLIIGREMVMTPNLLIAAHPTRGIDVGAQAAVWETLHRAREQGLAVLLVSADLDELIGLSDRLLVVFRGRISAALDPATVTPRELGAHMTGAAADVEEPQPA